MSKEVSVQEKTMNNIVKETGFTSKQIEVLKNTTFNTLKTESQVILALKTAQRYELDPFVKELYAWVDNRGALVSIASAAGFMKIARKQPGFKSIESHAVYEGEEFNMDTGTGEVTHKINPAHRGKDKTPLGAYARLKREGEVDLVKWVDWDDYAKQTTKFDSPWNNQKAAMIGKCATTVLLREAYGLSGLYGEEETEKLRTKGNFGTGNDVDKESVAKAIKEREKAMNGTNEVQEAEIETE